MFEVTLLALAASAEAVSDALIDDCDALSASVEDADADTLGEQAIFGEPGVPAEATTWPRSIVRALFHDAESAGAAATRMLAFGEGKVEFRGIEPMPDLDWVRSTQAQFPPSEIAEGFWVVPTWHEPPPDAKRLVRLDPGMAFGTGTHPTTRMCLRWIARHSTPASPWARVLDYGCGSGILAIGAALHGAKGVDAVDIDPQAVAAAKANAVANGVGIQVGLPDLASGCYDLVLANILATPLKLLAPLLARHLVEGGRLVMAGILERQADEIEAAYAPWMQVEVSDEEDGWILVTGTAGRGLPGRQPSAADA